MRRARPVIYGPALQTLRTMSTPYLDQVRHIFGPGPAICTQMCFRAKVFIIICLRKVPCLYNGTVFCILAL